MRPGRWSSLALGMLVWLLVLLGLAISVSTVRARANRDVAYVLLQSASQCELAPGDLVFTSTPAGLVFAGEVSAGNGEVDVTTLAIGRSVFPQVNASTLAYCWRTPLSAEDAIELLLPPAIQNRAAETLADDWRAHDSKVAAAWSPLIAELTSAYLQVISDDLEAALQRHQDELLAIARAHGRQVAQDWPAIHEKLQPILQLHVTPVLGRLVSRGILEAPKLAVAWNLARGRDAEAYQIMLDWLAEYLSNMPAADKAEMSEAVRTAWDAARDDPLIRGRISRMGRRIVEDRRLHEVIEEIYREAITQNPRTAEFMRTRVLESPRVRERMYEFIELFSPTVRRVAALCLFDETGTTRPEVVHLARSIALGRRISWVTLQTLDPHAPSLESGASLEAHSVGAGS